jgi:hypothetical protein
MGKVPAYGYTQRSAVARYELYIEELARVELDTRQQDQCSRWRMLGYD